MFIKDVQKFIHQFKMISEAVTLPQIRRGIVGKEKEIPVIDSDKEWYEEHKKEVLNTIEKALNVDNKTLKNNLQKFDTDDFFTNDKPRKLKVKELLKSVRKNFISEVERSRMTEEKTTGIESQYEMMKMKNGVEVYAVYTPMANKYLTHTKLWVRGCFIPSWCIASSSANNYWNNYHLYEAKYPSVFIVTQKTKNGYNKEKYELKCDPYKSISFKDGEISLVEWVDEWRNPEQNERENSFEDTSLFETFKIDREDLENTIRKLVNSKKAEGFSKKYGREMIELYTKKIESGDEDTKLEYLTKACKNGTFINFCDEIDEEDKEYFLDELIRYGTLTEAEVEKMGLIDNEKAILNLIKNKRCTILSLEWAKYYFGGNMVRRVYKSLPDEILLMENFNGINVRKNIFETIRDVDGLTIDYINYLTQKGEVNNTTLRYVKNDKEILTKCIYLMIENGKVDNYTLYDVKNDKELLSKCLNYLIENGKVDNYTLEYYIKDDKDLLRKCVDKLISNDGVDDDTLKYVGRDEESLRKCVDYLISKNRIGRKTLSNLFSLDNNMSMIKRLLIYLVNKNEVHEIYFALGDGYENITLCKILDEREMNDVLRSLLSYKDYHGNYIRLYREILKRCSLSTKMISCHVLFNREKLHIDNILNFTFKNSEDDESILKNLVKCFISSGYKSYFDKALNDVYEGRYALYYLVNALENDNRGDYFGKCIENIEKFENTYKDFISFLKRNKEYSERAEMWLGHPLFGETEEKNKMTQMRNLYKLFERKYKENGYKSNEEIKNIIRQMIDIGFYQSNKKFYSPIVALISDDDISEDNVKMIEEILKQIGEENYNDKLLNYMTWNKKFYKFTPHIVDVLISKNDIGASLMDIIKDDEIIDINSAKKLANWIIKNKNTLDEETKMSVDYVKENHPDIYEKLFGDKL